MTKPTISTIKWIKTEGGVVDSLPENLSIMTDLLNSTGCGFCLAKFKQVTMHLGTGLVHACHHPTAHKIPLDEIESDPAALFNTSVLKKAREEMMAGKRPAECDYCWRIEDTHGTSDRTYKSIEHWARPYHDEVVNSAPTDTFFPSYLEVDFSNVCNLSCVYCGPEFSSKWVETLKQKGPVKLLEHTSKVQWFHGWQDLDSVAYKNREHNPYVDAFWKWFPIAYSHLRVFRITGGEPLLSKETFKSLQWFIDNPNPELELCINSNLCVPEKLWQQFLELATKLVETKSINRLTLFTSIDGFGAQAEYMRPGFDFKMFVARVREVLDIGKIRVTFMCTFNILSLTTFVDLLQWVYFLKITYNRSHELSKLEQDYDIDLGNHTNRNATHQNHYALVGIDIPYLRAPSWLDTQYIDRGLLDKFLPPILKYLETSPGHPQRGSHMGFEHYEIDKFKRLAQNLTSTIHSRSEPDDTTLLNNAKFADFIDDVDARHATNFSKTFPELVTFYNTCKAHADSIKQSERK